MGRGTEKNNLEKYLKQNNLKKNVNKINFQDNPFCLLKKNTYLF